MAANSKRQTMECQCNLQQHSERITPNIIVTFSDINATNFSIQANCNPHLIGLQRNIINYTVINTNSEVLRKQISAGMC